jgi:hypothetical protein
VKLVKLGTLDSRDRSDLDFDEFTTLARATAISGKTTTPATGMRIHQPGTMKQAYKQMSRKNIASMY